jgi:hypothetical protein
MMRWILVVSTVLVVAGRFCIPGHGLSLAGTYEALAHIWVGLMIAVAYYERENRILAVVLLVVATVIETAVFLLR